ncbi:MAG: DUF2380 domain-containing protein [Candidatus Thiodiazotropha sp.]
MSTSKSYRSLILKFRNAVQSGYKPGLLLLVAALSTPAGAGAATGGRLAVLPMEIVDNTPVAGGEERNAAMLEKLTRFIAQRLEDENIFEVVAPAKVDEIVSNANLGTYIHTCNRCEYDLARQAGGDKVMVGWIYKMSLLILTLHIEIKDVESEQTLLSKAYDFRGDNEKAWLRAANYMVRDLGEIMARQAP